MNLVNSNDLELNDENLKIEFGCGDKLTKGYVGCDIEVFLMSVYLQSMGN